MPIMFARVLDAVFPPCCAGCGTTKAALCERCVPISPPIVHRTATLHVEALGTYGGALRSAVVALKDGRADVAAALGLRMARFAGASMPIVPVPTTRARRRVRGCDGVETMATFAATHAGASILCALRCIGEGRQRGRTREQRLGAQDRFVAVSPIVEGMTVVLFDDVCTTGTTLEDCAHALRCAGAHVEHAFVVAIAPRRAHE
ncbi:MAG TPA: phosphoribosyltransferase family protein [Candidatus Aquilonibacter sp.]|nr:phosphoribosyltransferase family protein [Candidatus Aquilonibacter sp.]